VNVAVEVRVRPTSTLSVPEGENDRLPVASAHLNGDGGRLVPTGEEVQLLGDDVDVELRVDLGAAAHLAQVEDGADRVVAALAGGDVDPDRVAPVLLRLAVDLDEALGTLYLTGLGGIRGERSPVEAVEGGGGVLRVVVDRLGVEERSSGDKEALLGSIGIGLGLLIRGKRNLLVPALVPRRVEPPAEETLLQLRKLDCLTMCP
jgi:hypothetical protein